MKLSKLQRDYVREIYRALAEAGCTNTGTAHATTLEWLEEGDTLKARIIKPDGSRSWLFWIPGLDGTEILADYGNSLNEWLEPVMDRFLELEAG